MLSGAELTDAILRVAAGWAATQPDIVGLALVGSWARGTARPDSDIDLVVLARDPEHYRRDRSWLTEIDWALVGLPVIGWRDADYGAVWSRHITLAAAVEVEFSFGDLAWAGAEPIDSGTRAVVAGGFRPLYDPRSLLALLLDSIATECDP